MASCPITVKRINYRGSNASKQSKARAYNQKAAELESYVNDLLKNQSDNLILGEVDFIEAFTGHQNLIHVWNLFSLEADVVQKVSRL